jgi:hypothetical protein
MQLCIVSLNYVKKLLENTLSIEKKLFKIESFFDDCRSAFFRLPCNREGSHASRCAACITSIHAAPSLCISLMSSTRSSSLQRQQEWSYFMHQLDAGGACLAQVCLPPAASIFAESGKMAQKGNVRLRNQQDQ